MKTTTESINNIKMLKLYAWQDSFLERIFRRRDKELSSLKKINISAAFVISGVYLAPNLLPAATFSVYIATGHTLDYNVAVAALIIFSLMQEPLIQVPYFVQELVEVISSLKRIEGFLDLNEVQQGVVEHGSAGNSEIALSVKGNFSWGFSMKKKDDEDKKVKEDGKVEEEEEAKSEANKE